MGGAPRGDQEGAEALKLPEEPSAEEDRRKHLEFIQAVIARMATASSNAKSWLLPVVTAAYGYAVTQRADSVAFLGIVAVLIFAFLDANYLHKEQEYRALYKVAAGLRSSQQEPRTIPLFSMDLPKSGSPPEKGAGWRHKLAWMRHYWIPGRDVWLSWSVAPFYGSFLAAGVLVCLLIYIRG